MPLIYSERALGDLDRLVEFLLADDPREAARTVDLIVGALQVLDDHPLIGRRVDDALRELVISRGRSGYVALYRFDAVAGLVFVLTIRHQREAGYPVDDEG